jgi:hypothetical protein
LKVFCPLPDGEYFKKPYHRILSIPSGYVTKIAVQPEVYKELGLKFNSNIMKIGSLITSSFLGFLIVLTLVSCKEEKTPQSTSTEETQEIVMAGKTESALSVENYFPGPNLMKYIVSEDNGLALTVDQEKTFAKWREMNHTRIQEKLMQISQLETEIESLSLAGVEAEEILKKETEAEGIRSEIANTKFLCHDLIRETLSPEQWETLVTGYDTNFPLLERSKMKQVMQHVNPVPNFMKVIESDSKVLDLSPEQEAKFEAWRVEYHPQMMEMANQIIDLEREIYTGSLHKEPKEDLLNRVVQINQVRSEIVRTKTNCRDMLMHTLDEGQWQILLEKLS